MPNFLSLSLKDHKKYPYTLYYGKIKVVTETDHSSESRLMWLNFHCLVDIKIVKLCTGKIIVPEHINTNTHNLKWMSLFVMYSNTKTQFTDLTISDLCYQKNVGLSICLLPRIIIGNMSAIPDYYYVADCWNIHFSIKTESSCLINSLILQC